MSRTGKRGKQLELWTQKLFKELGYRSEPEDGKEIFYADKKDGKFTYPMFQVDVEYYTKVLGARIVCECKNYTDIKYLNIEETLNGLLARVYVSGAVKGRLIVPLIVPSKRSKEKNYGSVIEICDLDDLKLLDEKRRKRHPLTNLFERTMSMRDQIAAMQFDPRKNYRRDYRELVNDPNEAMARKYGTYN